jgi:hypothetical protein
MECMGLRKALVRGYEMYGTKEGSGTGLCYVLDRGGFWYLAMECMGLRRVVVRGYGMYGTKEGSGTRL